MAQRRMELLLPSANSRTLDATWKIHNWMTTVNATCAAVDGDGKVKEFDGRIAVPNSACPRRTSPHWRMI